MSFTTFSTALSGLSTNTKGLNVVGNNLANLNTTAFKGNSVNFMEVLGQSMNGMGAQAGRVTTNFTQGGLQTTNSATDVAIHGEGFFVVSDGKGQYFTRAGNFHVDADGNLVSEVGHRVQGYSKDPATGEINTNGTLADIKMPATTGYSTPTSEIELAFNLDAAAPVGATFSTAVPIHDSLGQPHMATFRFVKDSVAAGQTSWKFDVTVPHKEFEGVSPTSTDEYSLITGGIAPATPDAATLVFDSSGMLTSVYTGATPSTLPPAANLDMPPAGVTLPDLANGGAIAPDGLRLNLLSSNGDTNATALASPSNVTFSNQNGVPPGDVTSLSIREDGTVVGVLDNGLTLDMAKIALAEFNNEGGLVPQGSGLFSASSESGSVLLGSPGEGGRGRLVGGSLELSNVDLAAEFTKIIAFQRGYQANARMITTTDQILQETMNLRQ